jgi:hypothetical protein
METHSLGESGALTRLRTLVALGDPDGTVTLRWLAGVLGETAPDVHVRSPEPDSLADLTVQDAAGIIRRRPSTVRGWCAAGLLTGAYRLNDREWRIPRAALLAFQRRQGDRGTRELSQQSGMRSRANLGAWRKIRGAKAA